MAIRVFKPTTPGRRGAVDIVTPDLHRGKPHRSLVKKLQKRGGRNNLGRITVRHQGGGSKRLYRMIDFKRNKDGVEAKVERLEYDPNRSAHIALLSYVDGEWGYIIAPEGLKVGDRVRSGAGSEIKPGNAMPLNTIPVGTTIHCIELRPGRGAQLARSAGAKAQIVGREGGFCIVRLRSGESRKILLNCRATVGEVGHNEHFLRKFGKAGVKRWLGIRPTVRGVAMNPVDHPHGGGEGKTSGGRHPVTPWGKPTKGYRTRHNKKSSDKYILRRRK